MLDIISYGFQCVAVLFGVLIAEFPFKGSISANINLKWL